MDRSNLYKCIKENSIAVWQRAAHTSVSLLAAHREPYINPISSRKMTEIFVKKREERGKCNGMIVLRF